MLPSFSRLFWLFRVLWFHTNIWIICSVSVEDAIGILIGLALNLYIVWDSMDILIIMILPIHEHEISVHLLVSSIPFIKVL